MQFIFVDFHCAHSNLHELLPAGMTSSLFMRQTMTIGKFDQQQLETDIIAMLKTIYAPEIPVNIYDLGLIYKIEIDAAGIVNIEMTLTAPGCPVAQTFPGTVEVAIKSVPGVSDAKVELVWEPQWTKDRMSEVAKLQLGMFD